jgi:hypothetical protein
MLRSTPTNVHLELQHGKIVMLQDRLDRSQDLLLNFLTYLDVIAVYNSNKSGYHFKLKT